MVLFRAPMHVLACRKRGLKLVRGRAVGTGPQNGCRIASLNIPYSGKIWRGLKFGDLASSLELVKFNSSPNFPPFNTLLAAIAATIPGCSVSYDTAQVQRLFARREGLNMLPRTALQGPQNTSLARLAKLLMNRPHEDLKANIYWWVLRIGHLPLAAEVLADSGRPNRSVSMIAANAAFDFERTVPSSILTNLANDCVIVSEESAKYKSRQMLKTGQSSNILPAKFSRYTVCYYIKRLIEVLTFHFHVHTLM